MSERRYQKPSYSGRGNDRQRGGGDRQDRDQRERSEDFGGYRGQRGSTRGRGGYGRGGGSNYERRGDSNFSRGRGDSNFRNRGDERAPIERLQEENMFENIDSQKLTPKDNELISACGERYGTFGEPIPLSSNYFRVKALPNRTIHQYVVTYQPDIESRRLRAGLLLSQKELIKDIYAFDGTILFLPFKIDNTSFEIKTSQGTDVSISITYTNSVSPGSPTSVTIFNLIVRRVMKMLDMKQIKRHHFDPREAKIVENFGLEVWPGVSGSLVFYNNLPLYCVDVSHHVMRRESVYEFMTQAMSSGSRVTKEEIERQIVGQVVMTRYNNRTYRIDSINFNLTPSSEFTLKDGTKITFAEYYKKHYNLDIEDLKQPLLASIMKERRVKHETKQAAQQGEVRTPTENIVYLIPELSFLTGISDELRSNFSTMRELSRFTRIAPTGRCNGVYGFLKRVNQNPSASTYLNSWGVDFNRQLITLPGRKFPPEKVYFNDEANPATPTDDNLDWSQSFRNAHLLNAGKIKSWVWFSSQRDQQSAQDFCKILLQSCNQLGFSVPQPDMITVRGSSASDFVRGFSEIRKKDYDMALFLIPPNRKEIYDAIKVTCCVEIPIPSQVVLTKTVTRPKGVMSVATKISVQICAKLGGEPWCVAIPSKQKMIVGIDVCHDTGSKANSWLGFVASLNNSFTRYYSKATRQPSRTEIADSLYANMKNALEQYYKFNKCMPDAVIIYRDGVGDGQLEVVRLHELPSVQTCLEETCSKYGTVPTLAYLIVRKRINTRLFTVGSTSASNPLPGSLVDRIITRDDCPNFYLVSQCVREGTVNPTHYLVIYNNSKLTTTHLQRLSYKTCYLYFNWMGTVRVPAPCQYAHKLCFL
ncbi:hypothetical protein HZS_5224, partial [Henneguya salminicola]